MAHAESEAALEALLGSQAAFSNAPPDEPVRIRSCDSSRTYVDAVDKSSDDTDFFDAQSDDEFRSDEDGVCDGQAGSSQGIKRDASHCATIIYCLWGVPPAC
eukprot:scaffold666450_cov38-Prasinocladus_malaysianus.AAC.1